ncbi:unnamed protein product [Camellia sinensis]
MTMTMMQQKDPVEVLELMIKRTSSTSTAKGLVIKAGGILLLLIYSRCKNCANVAPDVFGIEEDLEEPEHIVSVGNLN